MTSRIVVLEGLPIVPSTKHQKLSNVIRKLVESFGTIAENGFMMPQDAAGTSRGFAYVQLSTEAEAAQAIRLGNGYRLDTSHTFRVRAYQAP